MAQIIIPSSGKTFDSSEVDTRNSTFREKGASKGRTFGWESPSTQETYEEDELQLKLFTVVKPMDLITGSDARSVFEQLRAVGVYIP